MRNYPQVGELASRARERLSSFTGLHMTPPEWLHMTTLVAGPAEHFTDRQIQQMAAVASEQLADVPPIAASFGKILYHPEAIMLAVTSAAELAPIRAAAVTATKAVTGSMTSDEAPWTPHVTLCYSTADQPAQPVIAALGMELPGRHRRREPRDSERSGV